jgi:hypothetical protein
MKMAIEFARTKFGSDQANLGKARELIYQKMAQNLPKQFTSQMEQLGYGKNNVFPTGQL